MDYHNISIIIPCYNEARNIESLLSKLTEKFGKSEIIVVDDCSSDNSFDIASNFNIRVIKHPYNMGNGASVKTGARNAKGNILVFMDADGQHAPDDIPKLISTLDKGYDMVVGARNSGSQASWGRLCANALYNRLASWMTNQKILDLTSGFRAVRTDKFREFLSLLPNGFSYPTTITMSFFRSGYTVNYVSINAKKRLGKSHIKPLTDAIRFLLIIFKVGTLYSPLKLFLPISFSFFMTGLGYYLYTYLSEGRFTNMSALLFSTSVLIFLIGLVSEQITSLIYRNTGN